MKNKQSLKFHYEKLQFKIQKLLRNNYLLIGLLLISFFFRFYEGQEFFLYSHDQDLVSWVIKDIIVNKHPRLIGQLTSTPGIFIGPYFYYFLIPFYLLFKMDPIGGVLAVGLISVFTTYSFYFVFSSLYGKRYGLLAAYVHSTNYFLMLTERDVVPTQPMFLWSLWFFYGLTKIMKNDFKGYLIVSILAGLIWSINFSLILSLPLVFIAIFFSKKLNVRGLVVGFLIFLTMSSPLILFELRHDFIQTKAFVQAVFGGHVDVAGGINRFERVLFLIAKNVHGLYFGTTLDINFTFAFTLGIFALLLLWQLKKLETKIAVLFGVWIAGHVVFFSINSKILSEYYLNGMLLVWIYVLVLGMGYLVFESKYRKWGVLLLMIYIVLNFYKFFIHPINASGYRERKAVVLAIKEDATKRDFPCVSISYITSPGNDLGYRYFYFLFKMHVNYPKSQAPVYTVVYPHSMVDKLDRTFGAIGLILPDYERYSKEGISYSCSGGNSNEIDPLFGYTE